MFQRYAITLAVVTVGAIATHAMTVRPRLVARARGASWATKSRIGWVGRLVYLLLILSMAGLALTGLPGAVFTRPGTLSGWTLWMHFFVAPAFISMLLALVFCWGERNRFSERPGGFARASRVMFWVVAALGFIVIATIVGSMMPVLPSESQRTMYAIHRYSATALVMAMLAHLYTLTLPGQSPRPAPSAA